MHHIHQSCPRPDRARTLPRVAPFWLSATSRRERRAGKHPGEFHGPHPGVGQPSSAAVTSPMWVFVSLLVPFGMLLEASGPKGPDSGGGIMAAMILWSMVSLIFFIANAGLLISLSPEAGRQ